MARRKNNYYLSERKTYHLPYSISRHFIVLLHSVIRMNAFGYWCKVVIDVLWSPVIAWSSKHPIIAKQHRVDGRLRTKCNVFKIRKERLTYWQEENEFWGEWYGYETDNLKNYLHLELFDRESKLSGFMWLIWIHINVFRQLLVESISSVVWQTMSISREKLKAKGKRNAFNKPS